jgi:HNH endonuclease
MRIKRTRADDLFSRYIRARDGCCLNCGATGRLECAHIFSRRHWATRHDPRNAIALCFACHTYFGGNPLVFAKWCEARFSAESMDELRLRAHQVAKKSKHEEGLRVVGLKEMLRT